MDPKLCQDEVVPLEKVPRLTVTRREVQKLPVVHDIQHWRQVNRKRREQKKAKLEAEKRPTLDELLDTPFGMAEEAELDEAAGMDRQRPIAAPKKGQGIAHERPSVVRTMSTKMSVELQERQPEPHPGSSRLQRSLHAVQQAAPGSDERESRLDEVSALSARVNDKCQRKVQQMHDKFLRKQGLLSNRLKRQVRRIQLDFQEIHDMKAAATAGAAAPPSPGNAKRQPGGGTVLRYLSRCRHTVERDRQSHHAAYMQQVERFQGHMRLLADPKRSPDRGEIYLSECFRHVLSAGLVVDGEYFFRVLRNLEAEDLERVSTVNLLAACCDAFGIDPCQYWAFLHETGLPRFGLRPCPVQVQTWEDQAEWKGVELQPPPPGGAVGGLSDEEPLPFAPILPDDALLTLEQIPRSKEDPLAKILATVAMDSVLERYRLGDGRREASRMRWGDSASGDEKEQATPQPQSARATVYSASSRAAAAGPAAADGPASAAATPRKLSPTAPPGPAVRARVPLTSRGVATPRVVLQWRPRAAHPTLRRTQCVAEPLGEMAAARAKGRAPRQAVPPLGPLSERSKLEHLE